MFKKLKKKPALHPRSTKQPNKLRMVDNTGTMMLHARLASSGMAKIFSSSAAATERKFAAPLFGRRGDTQMELSQKIGNKTARPSILPRQSRRRQKTRKRRRITSFPLKPLLPALSLLFLFFLRRRIPEMSPPLSSRIIPLGNAALKNIREEKKGEKVGGTRARAREKREKHVLRPKGKREKISPKFSGKENYGPAEFSSPLLSVQEVKAIKISVRHPPFPTRLTKKERKGEARQKGFSVLLFSFSFQPVFFCPKKSPPPTFSPSPVPVWGGMTSHANQRRDSTNLDILV